MTNSVWEGKKGNRAALKSEVTPSELYWGTITATISATHVNFLVDGDTVFAVVKYSDLIFPSDYPHFVDPLAVKQSTDANSISPQQFDIINRPAHYTQDRKYDPFEVAHDWKLPSTLGGAMKYIARAGRKPGSPYIQDLQKAIKCISREIELWSSAQNVVTSVETFSGQELSIPAFPVDADGARKKK